jgi:metal-responsive CopG/Arc/MetJ family transcriptional regulator
MSDDRNKEIARCYQEALSRLKKKHDDEFHKILAAVYAEHGLQVRKRLSRIESKYKQLAEAQAWLEKNDAL